MIKYIVTFLLLTSLGYLYDKYRSKMDVYDETENEKLIRKYLLNETYSSNNKPPLWIYINSEINARKWSSFGSRNSKQLNQPYLHITLKSIINSSNDEFNVCIINDDSIHKVLPAWSIDMNKLAEPLKTHYRNLALLKLLYNYGGLVVPQSYLALKNMGELYYSGIQNTGCFVSELPSNSILTTIKDTQPSISLMGSTKKHPIIKELCQYLETINAIDNTNEQDFDGNIERVLNDYILNKKINKINGKITGCLNDYDEYISINELIGTSYINFSKHMHGIYIPQQQILKRTKYEWFARQSVEQIYKSDIILCKYLLTSNQ